MILVKEITQWDAGMDCNHTYLLNESMSKAYGYFRGHNAKNLKMFSKPLPFDGRYRKFTVIKKGLVAPGEDDVETRTVTSASGNTYVISKENGVESCSCIGFRYHGKCKHLEI